MYSGKYHQKFVPGAVISSMDKSCGLGLWLGVKDDVLLLLVRRNNVDVDEMSESVMI